MSQQQSLEQLESNYWGEPPKDAPRLIKLCYSLRKRPIKSLEIEELRVLISQDIGLNYLIPLAIKNLERDILLEGDFYPGDLLLSVLGIESKAWQSLDLAREKLYKLIQKQRSKLETVSINKEIKDNLKIAIDKFMNISG